MTDDDNRKKQPPPGPAAGRSGTAGSIGAELGDLDFEPDALLDSLLEEGEPPQEVSAEPSEPPEDSTAQEDADPAPLDENEPPESLPGPKLHEPAAREFPADEVTIAGARDEIAGPTAPKPPTIPRPATPNVTAKPPAVNPAGPSSREPFPPARSPAGPPAVPIATRPEPTPGGKPRIDPLGKTRPAADPLGTTMAAADPLGKTLAGAPQPGPTGPTMPSQPADVAIEDLGGEEVEDLDADELGMEDLGGGTPSEVDPLEFDSVDDSGPVVQDQATVLGGAAEVELARGGALRPSAARVGQQWDDERPAVAHLDERSLTALWTERAQWLSAEAEGLSEGAKARALIAASELWAMAGDVEKAREAAQRAAAASGKSVAAHRQIRTLATVDHDWKAVSAAVEAEARVAPNPTSRGHVTYFGAEVQRMHVHDEAAAQRQLDKLARILASDPRPGIAALAKQLAAGDLPKLRWGAEAELEPLARATTDVLRLRGAPAPADAPPPPPGAALALETARQKLGAGDRVSAGDAVAALATVEGLEGAARWLGASLLAHEAESRPRSIELLRGLLERDPTGAARRALAARSLEQGDADAVTSALAPPKEGERDSFSAADRAALAALLGSDEATAQWVPVIAEEAPLRPLAAAAAAVGNREGTPAVFAGGPSAQAVARIGRALAANDSAAALETALPAFLETDPDSALGRALVLEGALARRAVGEVADQLSRWSDDEAVDAKLAAAILREVGDDGDGARAELMEALGAPAAGELPARALLGALDAARASDLLATIARSIEDGAHRALLLVEAALRRGPADAAAYVHLLEEAAASEPSLPFPYALGEVAARSTGDADRLLEWIRARRAASADPGERALDAVREALLTADDDLGGAAELLEEASRARPNDVALRELHERLAPDSTGAGAWREEVAAASEGATKQQLLLAAALAYERDGDLEGAARTASAAAESDGSALAHALAERTAAHGPAAARLAERLLAEAKETDDVSRQRELYERLSLIDEARGEEASARLWHSAILEADPDHLPSLRHLEHDFLGAGRGDDLAPIATKLSELFDDEEGVAHAALAVRFIVKNGSWDDARPIVERTAKRDPAPLWALRDLVAHARAAGDDATALDAAQRLADRTERPYDSATLRLRAAEAATRLGRLDDAKALLASTLEAVPRHLVGLTTRADVLEAAGEPAAAAEAWEAAADASGVDRHRLDAWYQAGLLWLDHTEETDRGRAALERAAAIDVTHGEAFARLQALYVQSEDRGKLADLLERRLAETTDEAERISLEVDRGRALAQVGEAEAAKQALRSALDANPEHVEALDAYAELCAGESDWEGAEQAWLQLARHLQEPERQAEVYRKLAELYDTELPNPQRAELSYQEVLKRQPNDAQAMEKLVQVYGRLNRPDDALELQSELVNAADNPDEKRARMIGLALVYEQIAGDQRKAESTLEKARKAWPAHPSTLRALADFYGRNQESAALKVLLDRSAADARRALNTGRFDPAFFETLAVVSELRGAADGAAIARSTLAALRGEPAALTGAGVAAGDPGLDDLIAPDLLTPALRSLLKKSGAALDGAYPVDLRTLRAQPLPAEAAGVGEQFRQVARAFGIPNLDLYVSPAVGPVCMPVSSAPPQVVFGKALLESDDDAARSFLFVRAMKILQLNGTALARTAPIDLWPVVAAFLKVFAPDWQPQGADPKKMADAQKRIAAAMPSHLEPDVPVLALEVTGTIGNRASQLATAIHELGNRAALLAIGDPVAAIRSIALAGGHEEGPPPDGPERLKWIVRNPEARDLAVFSVSDGYAQVRQRLGLSS